MFSPIAFTLLTINICSQYRIEHLLNESNTKNPAISISQILQDNEHIVPPSQ